MNTPSMTPPGAPSEEEENKAEVVEEEVLNESTEENAVDEEISEEDPEEDETELDDEDDDAPGDSFYETPENNAPCNWHIEGNVDGVVTATHLSGFTFEGSMSDYNEMLRS